MTAWSRLVVTLVAASIGAACGDDTGARTEPFGLTELSELVLPANQAPPGTEYFEEASGPATIDAFTMGVEDARAAFTNLRYQGGRIALFLSPDRIENTPLGGLPKATMTIGTGVMLFPDSDTASQALAVHQTTLVPSLADGLTELPATGLGDEATAHSFESNRQGDPGAIYAFRIHNAVLIVAGNGISSDDLLQVAKHIEQLAMQ
jgi:hypothetical protein